MGFNEKELALRQLVLDVENPRHLTLGGQPDTIKWMLDELGPKIVKLAKYIATYGWDRTERMLVIPDEDRARTWRVVDGNRRLTALRLLRDPTLASSRAYAKRFAKIAESMEFELPRTVPCVIADRMEDCVPILRAKHGGEAGGIGRVAWGATEKQRFDDRWVSGGGRYAAAVAAIDLAQRHGARQQSGDQKIPISTVDRFLRDRQVRALLGLDISGRKLLTTVPESESGKAMSRIVRDLGSGTVKVDDVKTQAQRLAYIRAWPPKDRPNLDSTLPVPQVVGHGGAVHAGRGRSRSSSLADRSTAVKPPAAHRAFQVVVELKKIAPEQCPNACAVLLRLLLEMTVDHYISKRLKSGHQETLHTRCSRTLKDLEENHALDKKVVRAVQRIVGGTTTQLFSLQMLHDLAHSDRMHPTPTDLRAYWQTLEPFLASSWQVSA